MEAVERGKKFRYNDTLSIQGDLPGNAVDTTTTATDLKFAIPNVQKRIIEMLQKRQLSRYA